MGIIQWFITSDTGLGGGGSLLSNNRELTCQTSSPSRLFVPGAIRERYPSDAFSYTECLRRDISSNPKISTLEQISNGVYDIQTFAEPANGRFNGKHLGLQLLTGSCRVGFFVFFFFLTNYYYNNRFYS